MNELDGGLRAADNGSQGYKNGQDTKEGENDMSTEPVVTLFGFGSEEPKDYPFEFLKHCIVGEESYTEQGAIIAFANQFAKLAQEAQGHYLFVRKAPELPQVSCSDGTFKWRMIGRFSIAKLKDEEV